MYSTDRQVTRLAIVVALLMVVSLSACDREPITELSSANPSSAEPPAAVRLPAGSASVGCEEARPLEAAATDQDLVVGPLSYGGLSDGRLFSDGVLPDAEGVRFFKIGPQLLLDHSATVTIGASAQSFAGIRTESGPAEGFSSVTYTSCSADSVASDVLGGWWVGGFTLVGRSAACVPLEIQIDGESDIRRLELSLGEVACT
jgi:hypothetical protein